ncbi:hypothetical protein [Ruegeria sp.]|uniref:hypothetical protein n=1 Tax=Ruegeria sp. TaxID=1879320 RepID=UPI003C7B6625
MMIALAIMGMIAVLLANALSFNRQTIERFHVLNSSTDEIYARRLLKQWIEQMPLSKRNGDNTFGLDGTRDSLTFGTLVDDGQFEAGWYTVFSVELQPQNGSSALVLRGLGRGEPNDQQIELQWTIANAVEHLSFSYFGQTDSSPQKAWYTDWSSDYPLPDLVKLEWETETGVPSPPITLLPGKHNHQRFMSLSSLLPPG